MGSRSDVVQQVSPPMKERTAVVRAMGAVVAYGGVDVKRCRGGPLVCNERLCLRHGSGLPIIRSEGETSTQDLILIICEEKDDVRMTGTRRGRDCRQSNPPNQCNHRQDSVSQGFRGRSGSNNVNVSVESTTQPLSQSLQTYENKPPNCHSRGLSRF